jgi:hypothetical protein
MSEHETPDPSERDPPPGVGPQAAAQMLDFTVAHVLELVKLERLSSRTTDDGIRTPVAEVEHFRAEHRGRRAAIREINQIVNETPRAGTPDVRGGRSSTPARSARRRRHRRLRARPRVAAGHPAQRRRRGRVRPRLVRAGYSRWSAGQLLGHLTGLGRGQAMAPRFAEQAELKLGIRAVNTTASGTLGPRPDGGAFTRLRIARTVSRAESTPLGGPTPGLRPPALPSASASDPGPTRTGEPFTTCARSSAG